MTAPSIWYVIPGRVDAEWMEGSEVKIFRDYALGWVLLERRLEELAARGAMVNEDTAQTRRIWSVAGRAMGD